MAQYTYVVIDSMGKEKKGNMEANSEMDVRSRLRAEGYTVLKLAEATGLSKEVKISFGAKASPRDLSVFSRQFVSMVNAGVTILDTLDMLADQTENKEMGKAIRGVHSEIQKGETLSDGLAKYPKIFPSIMVSMVAAGEASGKIDVAFERMSSHFEKSAKMKALIKKASVYPIIVAVVALAVVVVMLVKVIPSYETMFADLGTQLPLITRIVVALSKGIINYWYIILGAAIALFVGIKLYNQTESGKKLKGTISMKVPIFGKLRIKTESANYARTLSTLVYSGLPMIEALGITAGTMGNYWFAKALESAKEDVAKGIPLSEPVTSCGLFPPMVSHMTRIGEETGDLEGMLSRLADYYDDEVEMATQTVMAALEPMIILLLAAIVGTLVAAIMSPMFAMYGALDSL